MTITITSRAIWQERQVESSASNATLQSFARRFTVWSCCPRSWSISTGTRPSSRLVCKSQKIRTQWMTNKHRDSEWPSGSRRLSISCTNACIRSSRKNCLRSIRTLRLAWTLKDPSLTKPRKTAPQSSRSGDSKFWRNNNSFTRWTTVPRWASIYSNRASSVNCTCSNLPPRLRWCRRTCLTGQVPLPSAPIWSTRQWRRSGSGNCYHTRSSRKNNRSEQCDDSESTPQQHLLVIQRKTFVCIRNWRSLFIWMK